MSSEASETTDAAASARESQQEKQHHTAIVLFYKYFLPADDHANDVSLLLQQQPNVLETIRDFLRNLGVSLSLKGRLLLASEGINGSVSADCRGTLQCFIKQMEGFDLASACVSLPEVAVTNNTSSSHAGTENYLFRDIDWKLSSSKDDAILQPFPDLKVEIVKEIISTGGAVSVEDVKTMGGTHLSPQEFHQALQEHPDAVLIDVRNTFEHAIGHFVHPTTRESTINPEMVTFSSFDATFCAPNAASLQDKKILLYCTGGIRCEKASVMLKQRGVHDVSQLSGGIHRYLETYGKSGYFHGKNFVFDQRVVQRPSDCGVVSDRTTLEKFATAPNSDDDDVVGECIECCTPYDEICGSRLCTVCRDLVLVCPDCQMALREYHCYRHSSWKKCYFTFLDVFDRDELSIQRRELMELRDTFLPASQHKNVRRTLSRQIDKVSKRIQALEAGTVQIDRNAPRRCRTCGETNNVCNGRCWGFWKTTGGRVDQKECRKH